MKKRNFTRRIILYESSGFGAIVILIWLDEILDIPHLLLGAAPTPINIVECVLESALVLLLGLAVLLVTRRLLNRIGYLEGIRAIGSSGKRRRAGDQWIQLEQYIESHSEAVFSHGICPECMEEHWEEISGPAKTNTEEAQTKSDTVRSMPGGWSSAEVTPEVEKALDYVLERMNTFAKLEKILEVKTQVVAGLNYDIDFQLDNGEIWNTRVFRDLSGNYSMAKPANRKGMATSD